jgi:hypothetical protein
MAVRVSAKRCRGIPAAYIEAAVDLQDACSDEVRVFRSGLARGIVIR